MTDRSTVAAPDGGMAAPEHVARYALEPGGWIHHWLACGPVTAPLDGLATVIDPGGTPFGPGRRWAIANAPDSLDLKTRVYRQLPRAAWRPGPAPALNQPGPAGQARWRYAAADEDHLIDFGLFNFTPTWMDGWLYAGLLARAGTVVRAELLTIGPVRVWLNGVLQLHQVGFRYVEPLRAPLILGLDEGWNHLWLHGEMISWREAPMALGLRLPEAADISIGLPLGDVDAAAWQAAEAALSRLHFRRSVFPVPPLWIWLDDDSSESLAVDAEVSIPFPEHSITLSVDTDRLLPLARRQRIAVEPGQPAQLPLTTALASALEHLPNEFALTVQLRPVDGSPFQIRRTLLAGFAGFRETTYGDYETRRQEAREHLARMPYQVMGAMAALETGRATRVSAEAIDLACRFMEERCDCADFDAVSLLVLLSRFGDHPALAEQDRRRIEAAFANFKFWIDEPGVDAMCYFTENHQILFHVTAYLAGQRWPERIFSNSGQSGRWQQQRARRRIAEWILRRLRGGFSEWDSNAYLALDAFAMLALVECAHSRQLRQMATALLHKIFFALACQSYRGVHGCTHGRCYVSALKSARVENTSGLQRIAWGLGTFNGEARATGLLAMARNYRVPAILQAVGADQPDLLITRCQSAGRYRPRFDLQRGAWSVNTLTRRTPDGMLSAAVDHRPGAAGIQEHLWQATLGPEAVVFTSHPGNSREGEVARPNFWAGSARLPRVAMTGRTVVCLYNLALGGGLGFTHAYFPAEAFDEFALSGPWAFARSGNGYVALWTDGRDGVRLTRSGRDAYQELRSQGRGQIWLCHVGRADEDGDFGSFCRRVRASAPEVDGLSVRWHAPGGDAIAFGWEGPLLVNGQPQPLNGFPHYDTLYTHTPLGADRMTIRCRDQQLVLDLVRGQVLAGAGAERAGVQ